MWIMYVAFSALGLFISFFISNNKLSKEHQTVKTGLAEEERARKEAAERKKVNKAQIKEEKRASKEVLRNENLIENGDVVGTKA